MRIVLATTNAGKVAEMQALLDDSGLDVEVVARPDGLVVVEDALDRGGLVEGGHHSNARRASFRRRAAGGVLSGDGYTAAPRYLRYGRRVFVLPDAAVTPESLLQRQGF